jgi:hypothetical protein
MRGIMMLREILQEDPTMWKHIGTSGLFSIQSGQYDKALNASKRCWNWTR